jgi:hypothetical protein
MATGLKSHTVSELSRGASQVWESNPHAERQRWWTPRSRLHEVDTAYFLPSSFFAVATTRSGWNPNLFCSSLGGRTPRTSACR